MEERVHPIPFRTWKLSSPSPMILHNVMWESRPLPTSFKKPFAAKARRAFCRSVARYFFQLAQPYSFLFPMLFIWAASGGGRWGPVRGCRPSEAPSALPPDDPAGLVAYLHSHGLALRGFPYAFIPRGLRGLRSGSFLAALGDLPPRRAMPAHAFALHGKLPQMSHRVECIVY